jgi:aminopeptidase N
MAFRSILLLLFLVMPIFSQQPVIEPGVPLDLAKWRADRYSEVRYKLDLTLEKMSPVLKGTIEIKVKIGGAGGNALPDIILDWRKIRGKEELSTIGNVTLNGKTAEYEEKNEHIVIKNPASGENTVKLDFTSPILASGSAITRYIDREDQGEYIYSLFVPSDASTAFPVFDQPDLKARFQLKANLPADWVMVSNGRSTIPTTGQDSHSDHSPRSFYVFEETKPISTYVFAFSAGNFEIFKECLVRPASIAMVNACLKPDAQQNRETSQIYVRRSQANKFEQHAKEVFRLNREGVKFLESYFDYKFPFPKYDLVLIPEFPFGGMEHAGATFLREEAIIFPQEPTANNYISRANVIFHEAAHQWFGDTVTMRWFDDLWLKEGFAEFMAYKTLEKVMPEYNAWKIFYERNKQAAYLTDSTKGTTPIYQEIPNLSAAKSAYGNIVYRKAPSFLRQAEFYLGPDKFQTAVRMFLKKHEYANAGWEDLVKGFENVSGRDLKGWANVWVKKPGLATIRVEERDFENKTEGKRRGVLFSEDGSINDYRTMRTTAIFGFANGEREEEDVDFTAAVREGQVPTADTLHLLKPGSELSFVFPNYKDYGYGIFLLDEKSKRHILKNIQNEKDDFLRTMMWGALWDSVREAELDPKEYVELVVKNLGTEKDETTISSLLGRVSTATAYYLSDKQRDQIAPRLEKLLLDRIQTATTQGQKITFYRAFLNTAATPNARKILKDVLRTSMQQRPVINEGITPAAPPSPGPFGLPPLKTKDKFDIVTRLIVQNDPDAAALLADLEKIETSDEAKRYAYAAAAGIATKENKARFFSDFVNNKEISESWIEAGMNTFNSVRHSELTLPYLERALAELPNLKRNRKIFFVNGWLGAFIGGQTSEAALAIVNKFLAGTPALDRDLRLKILENVDGLERAVKIRKKFAK